MTKAGSVPTGAALLCADNRAASDARQGLDAGEAGQSDERLARTRIGEVGSAGGPPEGDARGPARRAHPAQAGRPRRSTPRRTSSSRCFARRWWGRTIPSRSGSGAGRTRPSRAASHPAGTAFRATTRPARWSPSPTRPFEGCLTARTEGSREAAPDPVAIDGGTSRPSRTRDKGREPLVGREMPRADACFARRPDLWAEPAPPRPAPRRRPGLWHARMSGSTTVSLSRAAARGRSATVVDLLEPAQVEQRDRGPAALAPSRGSARSRRSMARRRSPDISCASRALASSSSRVRSATRGSGSSRARRSSGSASARTPAWASRRWLAPRSAAGRGRAGRWARRGAGGEEEGGGGGLNEPLEPVGGPPQGGEVAGAAGEDEGRE